MWSYILNFKNIAPGDAGLGKTDILDPSLLGCKSVLLGSSVVLLTLSESTDGRLTHLAVHNRVDPWTGRHT